MRASRIVTAAFVAGGIVVVAANPGCSSSSSGSAFLEDAGVDARDATARAHQDAARRDTGIDSPMILRMADARKVEASVVSEAGFNDAKLDVGDACVSDAGVPGPGPVKHTCIIYPAGADDGNECDGHHDPPAPFPPNGSTGNGFDDNCNGLVDEGCACDNIGATKTCYLVPATQTVDGLPVGWCAANSVGTEVCSHQGESGGAWTGQCRGAQAPYANDVCAPGDFNCDGKPENPTTEGPDGGVEYESCACNVAPVQCPTEPLTTVPYPPADALPLEVNAAKWFTNPADVAQASAWTWTLTGGDCDNILPYPTFRMYSTSDGRFPSVLPVGTASTSLGANAKEHGWVASGTQLTTASPPGLASVVYPAFSLSGDYLLQGAFMLDGKAYTCSVDVQVRTPGLRAEGCWSTEGDDDDLDLHMVKINDFPECATSHAWSDLACSAANEDCYYGNCYGGSEGTYSVAWGYPSAPASGCTGWGSQTTGAVCHNPRLDRDANGLSGECDPTAENPANPVFCGPENINIDYPHDNDRFAVGLRFFGEDGGDSAPALSHVNIYCNGVRVLSAGYDPTVTPVNPYPALLTAGDDSSGDMWKVGIVTTHVDGVNGLTCDVDTTGSTKPDPTRDGSSAYCVDNAGKNGAVSQALLMSTGQEPATANTMCFH